MSRRCCLKDIRACDVTRDRNPARVSFFKVPESPELRAIFKARLLWPRNRPFPHEAFLCHTHFDPVDIFETKTGRRLKDNDVCPLQRTLQPLPGSSMIVAMADVPIVGFSVLQQAPKRRARVRKKLPSAATISSRGVAAVQNGKPSRVNHEQPDEDPEKLEKLQNDGFALVHVSRLDELTSHCLQPVNSGICGLPIIRKDKKAEGTALVWSMMCSQGHVRTWESQPRIQSRNCMFLGNFLFVAATILAGLTHDSVKGFFGLFGIFNLGMPAIFKQSEKSIHKAVMELYGSHEAEVHEELKTVGLPVLLAGHFRRIKPKNKSASSCYSVQDVQSGLITSFAVCTQKEEQCATVADLEAASRQAAFEKKQPEVETIAFCKERSLIAHNLQKSFQQRFSLTKHPDLWRLARKLKTRLSHLACEDGMEQVRPWIGCIMNHLISSARNCHGNSHIFLNAWSEMVHHVADEHFWVDKERKSQKCSHGIIEIPGNVPWLLPGSPVHEALSSLLLDEKLLEAMRNLSFVSHVSRYDKYQALVASHVPEDGSFQKCGLETRMALAIVDHNYRHLNRMKRPAQAGKNCDEWKHYLMQDCLRNVSGA